MNNKKIKKEYGKLNSLPLFIDLKTKKSKLGIIYTLYSDRFNLIELGFAESNKILETKLLKKELILLDKKQGMVRQLDLLITTLKEVGIEFTGQSNVRFSTSLIRHLSTLGWPVGKSLYKQRKIKKELSYA